MPVRIQFFHRGTDMTKLVKIAFVIAVATVAIAATHAGRDEAFHLACGNDADQRSAARNQDRQPLLNSAPKLTGCPVGRA